jgi:hypothetical protein
LVYQMRCSIGAIDFFAFNDRLVTFNAWFKEFASVTISAKHFFTSHEAMPILSVF